MDLCMSGLLGSALGNCTYKELSKTWIGKRAGERWQSGCKSMFAWGLDALAQLSCMETRGPSHWILAALGRLWIWRLSSLRVRAIPCRGRKLWALSRPYSWHLGREHLGCITVSTTKRFSFQVEGKPAFFPYAFVHLQKAQQCSGEKQGFGVGTSLCSGPWAGYLFSILSTRNWG